jgi:miniconductance mechanosensitive channel
VIDTNSIQLQADSTQTNLGLFRAYLETYLRKHQGVHQDMKLLVRHLPATSTGLPVELYFFTNETRAEIYEAIQADILEHAYAMLPRFDLRVYQNANEAI